VVPHGRRALVVVVLEDGAPGCPRLAELGLAQGPKLPVPGTHPGVAAGDVARLRQVPRLRVPVALLVAVAAMEVGDDRDRAPVGVMLGAMRIAALGPARRVRPVKRLVDRQQVRPEPAVGLQQLVDPLDAHGLAPRRLDRERRVVERLRVVDRAVAPHLGGAEPRHSREDLLLELADPDPVVVDPPALPAGELAAARHRWRDHQRRRVLRDRARVEHTGRERLCPRAAADEAPDEETGARPRAGLHEPSSRDWRPGK
jgi:hypothetical protein